MIRGKYAYDNVVAARGTVPLGETMGPAPSEEAQKRTRKMETGGYIHEKQIAPENMLRCTEDFSPVLELAFRSGITDHQSYISMRSIERVHREKTKEMDGWSAAMRKAEAERMRHMQSQDQDNELQLLREQLKSLRGRLTDKSKEAEDALTFHNQMESLRKQYDGGGNKSTDNNNFMEESPAQLSGYKGIVDANGRLSNHGKKQKLYNALHYSAIYDERTKSPTRQHIVPTSGNDNCPCCGARYVPETEPHGNLSNATGDAKPTPLTIHEKYFDKGSMPHQKGVKELPGLRVLGVPAEKPVDPSRSRVSLAPATVVRTRKSSGKEVIVEF